MEKDPNILADALDELGPPNPEDLARTEIESGDPILAYHLFLKRAWELVVPRNASWMEAEADGSDDDVSVALRSLLDCGASPKSLTNLVRNMQQRLLHRLCYLIDDPGVEVEAFEDRGWGLFETDDDGEPVAQISGLNESVIAMDPEREP